jgi:hypothetical protein
MAMLEQEARKKIMEKKRSAFHSGAICEVNLSGSESEMIGMPMVSTAGHQSNQNLVVQSVMKSGTTTIDEFDDASLEKVATCRNLYFSGKFGIHGTFRPDVYDNHLRGCNG